ncbi:hypothetical protein Tco_0263342, partial [Tanacetum coccineum]
MGRSGNDVPGALLHNTIAPVMRDLPLSVVLKVILYYLDSNAHQ